MTRSWLVVLIAVLLTACTPTGHPAAPTDVAPPPPPPVATSTPAAPEPLSPEQALGDFNSLDFCSLLDLDKAKGAGLTRPGSPVSAPNWCAVGAIAAGHEIDISVGNLAGAQEDQHRVPDVNADKLEQGPRVEIDTYDSAAECRRYLTFANGTHVSVQVSLAGDRTGTVDQRAALCAVEKALFTGVVERVTARTADHLKSLSYLAPTDLCTLLPDPHLLPGTLSHGILVIPAPNRHRCVWLDPVEQTEVQLSDDFFVQITGGTKTAIDDQTAIIKPADQYCSIYTLVGFSRWPGIAEYARLWVYVPDQAADPCTVAKTVAAATWPKLP